MKLDSIFSWQQWSSSVLSTMLPDGVNCSGSNLYQTGTEVLKGRFSFFVCVYFCFSLSLQLFLQLFFLKLSLMSHDSMISIAMGVIYIRQARRLLRQDSHSLFMFIFVFLYLYNYLFNFFLTTFLMPHDSKVSIAVGVIHIRQARRFLTCWQWNFS